MGTIWPKGRGEMKKKMIVEGGDMEIKWKNRENNEKTADIHRKSNESMSKNEIMVKLVPKILNFSVTWVPW